jgi:hypothetical protein
MSWRYEDMREDEKRVLTVICVILAGILGSGYYSNWHWFWGGGSSAQSQCSEATVTARFLDLNAKTADMISNGTPVEFWSRLQSQLVAAQSRMIAASMRNDLQSQCNEITKLEANFRQAGVQ